MKNSNSLFKSLASKVLPKTNSREFSFFPTLVFSAFLASLLAFDIGFANQFSTMTPYFLLVFFTLCPIDFFGRGLLASCLLLAGWITTFYLNRPRSFWLHNFHRLFNLSLIWLSVFYLYQRKKMEGSLIQILKEHRKKDELLSDRELQFQAVIENTAEGIIIIDKMGTIELVNPAVEKIFGYGRKELVGENVKLLMASPHREEHDQYLRRYLDTGQRKIPEHGRELKARRKDGEKIYIHLSLGEFALGGEKKFAGALMDITEQVRARKTLEKKKIQLEEYQNLLEERVQNRTKELQRANRLLKSQRTALRKSQAQLKSSLREKEILLGEVNHRVKNNLQTILSFLNMQLRQVKSEETHDLISQSLVRIQSMSLVHELLMKGENLDEIPMEKYITHLTDFTLKKFGWTLDEIDFVLHVDNVKIDINTVINCGIVLVELITNAAKYAFHFERRPQLTVGFKREEREKCQYLLYVKDNGPGLPQDFQMEKAKSLGLRLVKMMVHQLQGTWNYTFEKGAFFEIRF